MPRARHLRKEILWKSLEWSLDPVILETAAKTLMALGPSQERRIARLQSLHLAAFRLHAKRAFSSVCEIYEDVLRYTLNNAMGLRESLPVLLPR
jgi:hypothetical protein